MISGVSDLQFGAGGVLAIVIVAILAGLLLPRWTVKQLLRAAEDAIRFKDKEIAFKDEQIKLLGETVDNYRRANEKLIQSSGDMIAVNQVATKALHALTTGAYSGESDEIAQLQAPSEG
jgi:hypothetical protein